MAIKEVGAIISICIVALAVIAVWPEKKNGKWPWD